MTFTGTTNSGQFSAIRVDGVILKDPVTVNGNTAATNFNPFTVNINTQRGQESGYCTWNPLAVQQSGHGGFSDGNLEITADTAGSHKGTLATFAIPANWGQKPFKFPPPAGFQPLALANTPRPSIVRPDQYVGVTTYTGTSGATSVSNLQFKPDLVWLKNRDSGDGWHQWRDSVRGGDKNLASNSTAAESDASTKNLIFNSNGFTLTGTTDSRDDNYDGDDYVAWCWKAGGNSNTFNINDVGYDTASAAGLTAGTITPTGASVNTKSGFSIITYTGSGILGLFLTDYKKHPHS
jgi:hypothetical protein